ncbi:unnamed protein product [Choristocarpus tenellus]
MLKSLQSDGVDRVILQGHEQPIFSLAGSYRHVLVVPEGLEVRLDVDDEVLGKIAETDSGDPSTIAIEGCEELGMMSPSGTAKWLRESFREVVEYRYRYNKGVGSAVRGDGEEDLDGVDVKGVGGEGWAGAGLNKPGPGSPLLFAFELPVSSYATSLLQHLMGATDPFAYSVLEGGALVQE